MLLLSTSPSSAPHPSFRTLQKIPSSKISIPMADKTIEMLPRAHRHAKRALIPEVAFHKLKPRFSPTAIFSSETTPTTTSTVNAVPTTTQTCMPLSLNCMNTAYIECVISIAASSVTTPKATTTSANTQTASQTIQTQTTTSTSVSSTSTSTASSTTATSSIPTTTSTTSSAVVIVSDYIFSL